MGRVTEGPVLRYSSFSFCWPLRLNFMTGGEHDGLGKAEANTPLRIADSLFSPPRPEGRIVQYAGRIGADLFDAAVLSARGFSPMGNLTRAQDFATRALSVGVVYPPESQMALLYVAIEQSSLAAKSETALWSEHYLRDFCGRQQAEYRAVGQLRLHERLGQFVESQRDRRQESFSLDICFLQHFSGFAAPYRGVWFVDTSWLKETDGLLEAVAHAPNQQ